MYKRQISGKYAFTLIELLVVVAIIGILTAITLGIAGMAQRKSSEAKALAELQAIANSLEEYQIVYGVYPDDLQDLTDPNTKIALQYKDITEVDRWSRPFEYEVSTDRRTYELWSLGPDGLDQTEDDIDLGANTY